MSYTDEFINQVKNGAIISMEKHGVLASITIAQAILESDWGRSLLARESKNLFGVKAIGGWRGEKKLYPTYEYYDDKMVKINDYFRVYKNYNESIEDHALFLVNNSRYKENGFFKAKDYIGQAESLQRAGYATSPTYASSLIQLIKEFKLYKFDEIKKNEGFVNIDGGAYVAYKDGAPGINLIIKDYSENIDRVFAWVDLDKDASWAFAKIIPNEKYTILKKNTSKVITKRTGGYSFTKGAFYKIKVRGYDKRGQAIAYKEIIIKIPEK